MKNIDLRRFRKYLLKGLLFSIPFILYFLVILIVDPHDFFNVFHVISDNDKKSIINRNDESSPRGNLLFKTLKIKREKPKRVLVGDSQGTHINMNLIEECCGEKVFNYCIPGASFETLFKMFWTVVGEQPKIECVYFEVAFMNYNSNRSYDIYHFAQNYIDKPYLYLMTKENFYDAVMNVVYQITKDPKIVENSYEFQPVEEMDKLATQRLKMFFENYTYPDAYFDELVKISQYCKDNKIKLKFIILPTYKGVGEFLEGEKLSEMGQRFKDDIKSIGKTYDLDVQGELKNSRSAFIDYFHLRQPYLDQVTRQIWGNEEFMKN